MKVLLSWLREFVDVRESAEEIARVMSLRGFAVEGIERIADLSPEARSATGDLSVVARSATGDLSAVARSAKEEAVIDFEVTGNRPDCMSVVGMAREIATAFDVPMTRRPGAAVASVSTEGGPGDGGGPAAITIALDNPDLCPYYAGGIADVTVGPSPDWMQARLKAGGVRPISNIVDVTNYVLLELGQPMHAFDFARLDGAQIRVRTARDGERLKTLDGQERTLTADMLVIADATRPVGIAGVMGGADSEVTGTTRSIVLESAYFSPPSIRRTSRKLGLKTEASTRFERGTDRMLPGTALRRACALLEQIGAARARGEVIAGTMVGIVPRVLPLRRARLAALLGIEVPDADVSRILTSLGFDLTAAAEGWSVAIPARRVDVSREVDLIEEVGRHYGLDRIPGRFPAVRQPPVAVDPRITGARRLRSVMTAAGFFEANTFGFIGASAAKSFHDEHDLVAIANPLSENFGVLRPSCLPGLVDAVAYNRHRQQRDVRLFEIGARFSRRDGERRAIGAVWAGAAGGDHWSGGTRPIDFFDIKGVAGQICSTLGLEDPRSEPAQVPWLVAGRAALLRHGDATIGVLGLLAPAVAERHGLTAGDAVYVVEIDLDAAASLVTDGTTRVEPLPRYPSVARDISILVDDTLPAAEIRQTVRRSAPPTLVTVREFDRYQGKGIPEGKVSLSLRLTFRSPDRTLTDAEVQTAMDGVLAALQGSHGAIQR